MLVTGLDIGGANLKAATSDGAAVDRVFPLWRFPERLEEELASLIAQLPRPDGIALTMTGELADCFPSKADGVRAIVAAARSAAGGTPVVVWQTGGEFLNPDDAVELPQLVAAANWHALAAFCGRVVPTGPALLVDIGSTTTDIVRLVDGRVMADGLTDLERLRTHELVYTGATRTPICAFGPTVSIGGKDVPLAAELFATVRDVHLLLGRLPEQAEDRDTADGRPATVVNARSRLARMLCSDPDEIGEAGVLALAQAIADRQDSLIRSAIEHVLDGFADAPHVLLSGSGEFLGHRVVTQIPQLTQSAITPLNELFAERVSRSACAFAVARLAAERVTL